MSLSTLATRPQRLQPATAQDRMSANYQEIGESLGKLYDIAQQREATARHLLESLEALLDGDLIKGGKKNRELVQRIVDGARKALPPEDSSDEG